MRDLRHLLWCSIDNDDSRDLDQLTVAEACPRNREDPRRRCRRRCHGQKGLGASTSMRGKIPLRSILPPRSSPCCRKDSRRTLPLSTTRRTGMATDRRNGGRRRRIAAQSDLYEALVLNQAKLAYNSVAAWLEGNGADAAQLAAVPGLDENLRLQDRVAQKLKTLRHEHGALTLETIEARLVFDDGQLKDLQAEERTGPRTYRGLHDRGERRDGAISRAKDLPSLRRVVRTPKRWDRIGSSRRSTAQRFPRSLMPGLSGGFLHRRKPPTRSGSPIFPLLSSSSWERVNTSSKFRGAAERPLRPRGQGLLPLHRPEPPLPGPDHAALAEGGHGGTAHALRERTSWRRLAKHCTEKEDAAKKVERQVRKSAAAMLLETGSASSSMPSLPALRKKDTWVRLLHPPIEGRLKSGFEGIDVGQRLRVQLIRTDVERGYIDFRRVGEAKG